MADQDEEQNGTDGGALRAQLEAALKKVKEAEDRVAAAEKTITDQKLTTFLTGKNVKAKAAKYIKLEGVDINDTAALEKWLEENPEFSESSAPGEIVEPPADPADAGTQTAWQTLQNAQSLGSATERDKFSAIDRTLKPGSSPEEVYAALAAGLG